MFDVFISHSSLDKKDIVNPLVDQLTKKGLKIWYDKTDIAKGDIIKDEIITGINESVVFIAVITNNFFESNWASLELGILQAISPNNLIPLISKDSKNFACQRYPFLFDHNYIEIDYPIQSIVEEINISVIRKKQEYGLWHINKTNLKSLTKEMRLYNDFKLDQLAIHINSLISKINKNIHASIVEINVIIESILKDVAYREKICLHNEKPLIDTFLDVDFISINLKEHIKFLKSVCQEDVIRLNRLDRFVQTELYLIQFSIFSIAEWYMLSYFKKPILSEKTIISVAPEEFTQDDVLQSYEIEKLVLPPDLIAEPSVVETWNKHNPLTFIGARDAHTGKLVGFFNTLPISDELYNEILSGNFDDTQIDVKHIKQYDLPGFYKLYLCSFCIHPAYNSTSAFKTIYNSFIDFLLNLAVQREIFISDIVADGVTQKGESLCESIGMSKTKNTNHNSFVYSARLIPPEFSTLKLNNIIGRRLIVYYEHIYNEYKELF